MVFGLDRLAARRLTVQDVEEPIRNQAASIPAGRIESDQVEFSVSLEGTLHTSKQFELLMVAYCEGYPGSSGRCRTGHQSATAVHCGGIPGGEEADHGVGQLDAPHV